jgi:dephospho-CoA kinase
MIVMISGRSGSGKDTVGEILKKNYTRLAFADELKKEVSKKYNIPIELMNSQEGKKTLIPGSEKTVREILIEHGEEERKKDKNVWIKKIISKIKKEKNYIITDWRFKNEYEEIKKNYEKIITIRIERKKINKIENDRGSETELDNYKFDYIVKNDGTIEELKKMILKIL